VALAAAGCGGGDGSGSSSVLSDDEVETAVLTLDNLDGDFVESEDDDDDDDSLGCLGDLDVDDSIDAKTEHEASFEVADAGFPSVGSKVASYASTQQLDHALDRLAQALAKCDHVDETDEDDATIVLDIETDTDRVSGDVDQQVNIHATGSVSSDGFDLPLAFDFSFARVDNNLTAVFIGDLSDTGAHDALEGYTEIAVDRLVAVMAGEAPEDATGPELGGSGFDDGSEGDDSASDDGSEDSEDDSATEESFATQPLDGGTYTWENGITQTLSVERVELWGGNKPDDFCGDGSCGVADPDDTRLVLRYDVSVPADFSEPFDPYSCPGGLHVTSGNDDEAFSQIAGDFDQELGGKILPGSSKFGVNEYYIEKAYAGAEFYIESSCGDTEMSGESVVFQGPLADLG
jgi:hypothetical protein